MIITRANFHDPSCWRRRIRIANTVCVASLPVRQLCHGAHFTPLVSFVSSDLPLFPVFLIREGRDRRRLPFCSSKSARIAAMPTTGFDLGWRRIASDVHKETSVSTSLTFAAAASPRRGSPPRPVQPILTRDGLPLECWSVLLKWWMRAEVPARSKVVSSAGFLLRQQRAMRTSVNPDRVFHPSGAARLLHQAV